MVTVCPPTVSSPLRSPNERFNSIVRLIVVPPVPVALEVMLIQGLLTAAVHGHPAVVVSVTSRGPPNAPRVKLPGETLYAQPLAWVTEKV